MGYTSTIGIGSMCGSDSFEVDFNILAGATDSRRRRDVGPLLPGTWRITATTISHGTVPGAPSVLWHEFWSGSAPVTPGGTEGITLIYPADFYYPCGTISDPPPEDYELCATGFTWEDVLPEVRPASDCLCDYHDLLFPAGSGCSELIYNQIIAVIGAGPLTVHYTLHGEWLAPPP